jgi:hypothetical protein
VGTRCKRAPAKVLTNNKIVGQATRNNIFLNSLLVGLVFVFFVTWGAKVIYLGKRKYPL